MSDQSALANMLSLRTKRGVSRLAYAVLILLSACTLVGPEYSQPEVSVPTDWQSRDALYSNSAVPEDAWWEYLNDPVLTTLIEKTRQQNNNIKTAGLRILEARAALGIATGSRYPQAQVATGSAAVVGASKSNANTGAGDLRFNQFDLGAAISWELDFWGRFERGIQAADAAYLASIAGYDELLILLTAQVADVYTVLRTAEEQIRIAEENLLAQQRSLDIVSLLFDSGDRSELDVIQARTLLLSTRATIPSFKTTVQQSKNALSALLGLPPSDLSEILNKSSGIPAIPAQVLIGVPADLLRQRPDIRKAEYLAMAQNAKVGLAAANLYPSFSIGGTLGLAASGNTGTSRSQDSGLDELFSGDSITYAAGPSFVWPFLNYGRIKNSIRVEDARLQQALLQYKEAVIQAAREAENSMVAFSNLRGQSEILQEAVSTARRSTELALLRYKEGFADYQRVLSAQQALFNQQGRYVGSQGNAVRSLIGVYKGFGGGWQAARENDLIDESTQDEMKNRTDWGDLIEQTNSSGP